MPKWNTKIDQNSPKFKENLWSKTDQRIWQKVAERSENLQFGTQKPILEPTKMKPKIIDQNPPKLKEKFGIFFALLNKPKQDSTNPQKNGQNWPNYHQIKSNKFGKRFENRQFGTRNQFFKKYDRFCTKSKKKQTQKMLHRIGQKIDQDITKSCPKNLAKDLKIVNLAPKTS